MLVWPNGVLFRTEPSSRSKLKRQSDRIDFRVPVQASWINGTGVLITRDAQTVQVNSNGGVLHLGERLSKGQEITLQRQREGNHAKTVRARVVSELDHREADGHLYALALLEPKPDFWDIDFPAPHQGISRLLMECSFCQRREVVYLDEKQLSSFEKHKAVARICKVCDAPSIWIEAQSELPPPGASAAKATAADRGVPRHNNMPSKARVLACIRQGKLHEEVAVCEEVSTDGISFRSRNQFPEGTRLEVAVPYTPGAGAIFVPIRVELSQAIPGAGVFRHGARYIEPPAGGGR